MRIRSGWDAGKGLLCGRNEKQVQKMEKCSMSSTEYKSATLDRSLLRFPKWFRVVS